MKYAISIFLGGELIDATDANHSDYFDKGLICPFCYEKVHFSNSYDKLVNNKIVNYSASFKHHKGDPLDCEARAKSSEGKELLQIISKEAKKQRVELWKKYLWDIFCKNKRDENIKVLKPLNVFLNTPINQTVDYYLEVLFTMDEYDNSFIPPGKPLGIIGKTYNRKLSSRKIRQLTQHLAKLFGAYPFDLIKNEPDFNNPFVYTITETYGDKNREPVVREEVFYSTEKAVRYTLNKFSRTWLIDIHNHWCINIPLSIHIDITMEIIHHLNQESNWDLRDRIWELACFYAAFYQDDPNFVYMYSLVAKIAEFPHLLEIPYIQEEMVTLISAISSAYLRLIFEVDWYTLSNLPWEKIKAKQQARSTSGKGFAR